MKSTFTRLSFPKNRYTLTLLASGVVGLLASFILTLDKIKLLENPNFVPKCSLSPIVTCISAMTSAQATTLGVPNSMVGIILYTALIVVGASMLVGVAYSKRISQIIIFVALGGFLFTNYLILQSVLVLHVICPWCSTVWITSPLILLCTVKIYAQRSSGKYTPKSNRIMALVIKNISLLILLWYACLFFLVAFIFREYWATLL